MKCRPTYGCKKIIINCEINVIKLIDEYDYICANQTVKFNSVLLLGLTIGVNEVPQNN